MYFNTENYSQQITANTEYFDKIYMTPMRSYFVMTEGTKSADMSDWLKNIEID